MGIGEEVLVRIYFVVVVGAKVSLYYLPFKNWTWTWTSIAGLLVR